MANNWKVGDTCWHNYRSFTVVKVTKKYLHLKAHGTIAKDLALTWQQQKDAILREIASAQKEMNEAHSQIGQLTKRMESLEQLIRELRAIIKEQEHI